MTSRGFTASAARNPALAWGLGGAVAVESIVVHLALMSRIPWLAWCSTGVGVLAILWIVRDYRALRGTVITVDAASFALAVGARARGIIPRAQIAEVRRATWRELPPDTEPSYLRPTQPGDPNVLVRLSVPASVRVAGILTRQVQVIGLSLDDPDGFVAALQ